LTTRPFRNHGTLAGNVARYKFWDNQRVLGSRERNVDFNQVGCLCNRGWIDGDNGALDPNGLKVFFRFRNNVCDIRSRYNRFSRCCLGGVIRGMLQHGKACQLNSPEDNNQQDWERQSELYDSRSAAMKFKHDLMFLFCHERR
jgi:hypothetical protein